jgi:hypothetical protein
MSATATTEAVEAARATRTEKATSPPAVRLPGRRWRDWRLVVGVVLVLGSAAAGALALAAADDTVAVWAARTDLVDGADLSAADLNLVSVRIEAPVNPYLTDAIPDGYVLVRPVGVGELVAASDIAPASEVAGESRLVAVAVSPDGLPGALRAGDTVDVWLVPDDLALAETAATLLLEAVSVASVPVIDSGFGASTDGESVVLRLTSDTIGDSDLAEVTSRVVAASAAGRVALTLDPGPR